MKVLGKLSCEEILIDKIGNTLNLQQVIKVKDFYYPPV